MPSTETMPPTKHAHCFCRASTSETLSCCRCIQDVELAALREQLVKAEVLVYDLATVTMEHPGWQGYPRTWKVINHPRIQEILKRPIVSQTTDRLGE